MPGQSLIPKKHRWWVTAVAIFCCALIAFSGVVQVAHAHPSGQWAQSDCALCHASHVVVELSIPQSLPQPVRVVARVRSAPQPIRAQWFFAFSLFTRPPPVDPAFA